MILIEKMASASGHRRDGKVILIEKMASDAAGWEGVSSSPCQLLLRRRASVRGTRTNRGAGPNGLFYIGGSPAVTLDPNGLFYAESRGLASLPCWTVTEQPRDQ